MRPFPTAAFRIALLPAVCLALLFALPACYSST